MVMLANAHAQCTYSYFDGFVENSDGTVTDPRNNSMWRKCSLGETWNKKSNSCGGTALKLDWFEAMHSSKAFRFLGKSDWRIPSFDELDSIAGKFRQCEDHSKNRAISTAILPGQLRGVRESAWTSTGTDRHYPESNDIYVNGFLASTFGFSNGSRGASRRIEEYKKSALLVRAGSDERQEEFNLGYSKLKETRIQFFNAQAEYENKSKKFQERQQAENRPISIVKGYGYTDKYDGLGLRVSHTVSCSSGQTTSIVYFQKTDMTFSGGIGFNNLNGDSLQAAAKHACN